MTELNKIALKILSNGKGILAADESTGTMTKRLESVNVKSNEENRLVKQDRINSVDGYWFASNSSINFFKTSPSKDSINDVTTYQYGEEGNINQITDSKYAKRQNGIWTLFDLTVTDFQKNSILFQEEKIWPEGPKDSDMRRILSPRYLSIGELNEALKLNISEYRRNNLSLEY